MGSAFDTDCPSWCARDHAAEPCGVVFCHESETSSVSVSRPRRTDAPERVDVQTTRYLPDDPGEPAWPALVEVATLAGERYRLFGLTPDEARRLAAFLVHAAQRAECDF
jgi:hypothetical protein